MARLPNRARKRAGFDAEPTLQLSPMTFQFDTPAILRVKGLARPMPSLSNRCLSPQRSAGEIAWRLRSHAWALLMCVGLLLAQTGFAQTSTNLARGKPVISSAATWGGLAVASLTDGDPNTFCHPLASSGNIGYYFQIDLGGSYLLEKILIRNRADCCPERLSNYGVEIYADNGGETGALNWSANVRTNASNSGASGVDTITATNRGAAGVFLGRFIRVVNRNGAGYSPQVAEVEAYGGSTPVIRGFAADRDTIASGQSTTLRWEILQALGASLSPDVGPVATNGSIVVNPGATTTYTLTATNVAGTTSATVLIGVDVTLDPPRISEFLTDNGGLLKDEDGDASDWIELSNPNPFGLDLTGYYLTDDPAVPMQWAFPSTRIPARGFLIVFASGKDRRNPGAELHTHFRLDAKGEYLALADPAGHILQQFPAEYPVTKTFPPQFKDVSYGVGSEGGTGFLRPATPGGANGPAYVGLVSDTKFSMDRGFYDTNFTVAITSATVGATIRYTTNRTEPTATQGLLYSAPINIQSTTILRAAAFKDGWAPTDIDTHTYVFPSNVIASAVMSTAITRNTNYAPQIRSGLLDVPSISIVTTGTINDTSETKSSIEWLRADGQPGFHESCGVRYYGGAFTVFNKKSFRLYFRSEYGTLKLKYPLFEGFDRGLAPVEEFDQLELRSGSHDMVDRGFYMSNIFTDDTLLEMGQLNPHGRFVHMYLNGVYWGLFHLRERWNAPMHANYLGGSRTNYESINGNWNVGGWAEPGTPYDGDGSTWERVKQLRGDYAAVKPLLDVPQYIDYMLMWMFGGSEDEYRCVSPNVPGSGFKFYLNDADGWFCGPWYCAVGDRTGRGAPGRSAGDGPGSIFSMLFKEAQPEYRILLADRIYQALFNQGALTPARNAARLRARCDEIQRAFLAEAARWNYLSPAEWASRRNHSLTNWLPFRTTEALGQFRSAGFYPTLDAPVLNQPGGPVPAGFHIRFLGPVRGSVYFTTDGSDPRLPGGAISPSARSFSITAPGETIIPAGSLWHWFTDATGLGGSDVVAGSPTWSAANWKHPDFDDTAWSEGPAQLGYGESDEATVIPFGGDPLNKWITSYFRRHFTVADASNLALVKLHLKRDDGAIVYLNGREVARSSMKTPVAIGTTLGTTASDDGQGFLDLVLSPDFLQAGDNVLTVELHQSAVNTPDASFDLGLDVLRFSLEGTTGVLPQATHSTRLKCRTKDGTTWSALNEAFFQVGPDPIRPGDVVISELNFDPPGLDASEFVELANVSSQAVNLRGTRFIEGIHYAFPSNRDTLLAPGERLLLVNDLFGFQRHYGLGVPVAGIFAGSLANDGEQITLATASSNLLAAMAYSSSLPWPTNAAGNGYTLVLAHPELGLAHPAAWRSSATPDGSPGGTDTSIFAGSAALDGDEDGLPAIVEYAFGTSDADPASGPGVVESGVDPLGRFTITFPRSLRADDVRLAVEASEDLLIWSPATLLSTRNTGPGLARETYGVEIFGRTTAYLRLRVVR